MFSLGERLSEAGHAAPLMMCCLPADAAAYQQEEDQRQTPPSASWHVTDTVTFPTKPVDDISFPVLTGPTSARAASSSPDRLAPTTPDQLLAPLPACKVNPISNFHNLLASQEEEEEAQDALASFHQLLISQELSKQDRLSRFHELLASQELNKDGELSQPCSHHGLSTGRPTEAHQGASSPACLIALERICVSWNHVAVLTAMPPKHPCVTLTFLQDSP